LRKGIDVIKPVINDYLDYRAYLKDMFSYLKEEDRYFSYRFFSRKAGFSSPNFLQLVITKKRNLTHDSALKVCRGFGLKKIEREYFESLVWFNQAADNNDRNHYYKKLMALKKDASARKLDKDSYEYFSKWFYPVIREVAVLGKRSMASDEIARFLSPSISVKDVENALSALENLGLIERDKKGRYKQTQRFVTTGPEVQSLIIANYHKEMLRLATESIERHKSVERDISALTLSIHSEKIPELKEYLSGIRRDILEKYGDEADSDRVVQLNIQLFPLTDILSKEEQTLK
jgi:uncharacterized protein (TIGR02147 family)